jgi:PadR family transcriptional regulator, regulatory protein PadR
MDIKPLTNIEEVILLAVFQLGVDAYGVRIRARVEEMTGKSFSVGAIYIPLDRLAKRKLLETKIGDPTPERGGRRKRFYTLSKSGLAALREAKRLHDAIWAGVPELDTKVSR